MNKYFDFHFLLPILEFENASPNTRLDFLKKTKMVDLKHQVYQKVNGKEDPAYKKDRSKILADLEQLQNKAIGILNIIQDPEVSDQLTGDKLADIQFLQTKYSYSESMLSSLYELAQFNYEIGSYKPCAEMLYHVRLLATDKKMIMNAMWGKLACEILTQNWDIALEDLIRIRDAIESTSFESNAEQLYSRAWLIHWALFPLFNHPKGKEAIVELFLQPRYLNAIHTACPEILKYLSAAMIVKNHNVKELIRVVSVKEATGEVSSFVNSLYVDYNFDAVEENLKKCEKLFEKDFFLASSWADFLEAARYLVFECFCSLNRSVNISDMSRWMIFSDDDSGENWMVTTIAQRNMKVTLDDENKMVHIRHYKQSVASELYEKMKPLYLRSKNISYHLGKADYHANAAASVDA